MAELDIVSTTTSTDLADFTTPSESTDGAGEQKETRWPNNNFNKWYGKYRKIAKLNIAINASATWVLGMGWTSKDKMQEQRLKRIRGWGEDSLTQILWNMLVIKKVNGDSFAEIIRNDSGNLINLNLSRIIHKMKLLYKTYFLKEHGFIQKRD